MPPTRRVAALFEPDAMGLRQRETLGGLARYAQAAGHWLLTLDPYAHQRQPAPYDGIIATARKGRGPALARSPVPVVCVTWGHVHHPQLVRVVENRYAAGRLAARHLVEAGCRSFAYLGFAKQTQSSIERYEFTLQLRKRGLQVYRARTFVTFASSRAWWDKVMARLDGWLERLARPAGLFVARPGFARAVAELALRRGLRIPEDLALVAADNDPALCELSPPLTAIHFDYAEVGYRAAELLDRLMDGQPPPRHSVLVPPTLVPRRSTDRQSLADPLIARALWFIDSRRTEPIRPRHVAEAVGIGQRALGDRMRRTRGRTILQEIILARVEHAKLQLEGSRLPLRVVARESGFGSYEAMLRAFNRHLGMPPSAWRRQHVTRDP